MPTPGQRDAGIVVRVRAAVNQLPSPCQQVLLDGVGQSEPHRAQMTDGTTLTFVRRDKQSDRWRSEGNKKGPTQTPAVDERYIKGRWLKHSVVEKPGFSQWLGAFLCKHGSERRGLWEGWSEVLHRKSILLLQYAIQAQNLFSLTISFFFLEWDTMIGVPSNDK